VILIPDIENDRISGPLVSRTRDFIQENPKRGCLLSGYLVYFIFFTIQISENPAGYPISACKICRISGKSLSCST
jgi:hypothetical protein